MTTRSAAGLIAVFGCALAVFGSARPAAADERLVAVLPLEIKGGIVASRQALEAAVGRGIGAGGFAVMFAEDMSSRIGGRVDLASCATPACFVEVGKAVNAGFLFRGSVRREDKEFRVEFTLVSARAGVTTGSEQGRCGEDECSVGELSRRTATALVQKAAPEPSAPEPVVIAPEPVVAAAVPAVAIAAPPARKPVPKWVAPAVAGVGAAAVVTGVALFLVDPCSKSSETNGPGTTCVKERPTRTWGVAVGGAGVALIAAGAFIHYRLQPSDASTGLALDFRADRVTLSGRF